MINTEFSIFYECDGISSDTRSIHPNSLFICIKGDNFDGNSFALKALENGAKHVIVDNPAFFVENGEMTLVMDSVDYLQRLANYHRAKFRIPIIGITGSNGKTTTKELIHAVLSMKYNVLATHGNLNNHLGVPFTLLRLKEEHEIAIIEMGANRFKDIEELCTIAEPTYGIITNIGKAHLEGFINFEGVLKTKKELYDAVEKRNGQIVVNTDDKVLNQILPTKIKTRTYGTSNNANVKGELISLTPFIKMKWQHEDYMSPEITTRMVGKYNFTNYLAAITFGVEFNIDYTLISEAIESFKPTNNRSQVVKTDKNTLIMDCYNANPTSMASALESFSMIEDKTKLVILGDMKELGVDSIEEHQKSIKQVEILNLKGFTVGNNFLKINSPAIEQQFANIDELNAFLSKHPVKGKLILLKGSRSIGLEKCKDLL